jgi:hypothetical protein
MFSVLSLIAFNYHAHFNLVFACVITFIWGFVDSGVATFSMCLLGFQFDSKTLPMCVWCIVDSSSFAIFLVLEAYIDSQAGYYVYFASMMVLQVLSFVYTYFCFEVRLDQLNAASQKALVIK